MTFEILAIWAAVTLYALGSILYVAGTVFRASWADRAAVWVSLAGLIPHLVGIGIRWVRVDHGPYLGFYEVVSSYALFAVLIFGGLALKWPRLRPVGMFVMPLVFLFLSGAMLASRTDLPITGKLASYWLIIHVTFAKLAYGSFVASFGLAVAYLVGARPPEGRLAAVVAKLPSQQVLDELAAKFVAAGFVFLGIMIVAGAIWANEAWGRYWGWDPIETWSLISWLVYALVMHLRYTLGWRGVRWAWIAAAALPVVLFALVGVPLAYDSMHAAYLSNA